MPKYVIEAQFLVPHYVRYCVEAGCVVEALAKLQRHEDSNPDFWMQQAEDFDTSGETTWSNVTTEYGRADLDNFSDLEDVT